MQSISLERFRDSAAIVLYSNLLDWAFLIRPYRSTSATPPTVDLRSDPVLASSCRTTNPTICSGHDGALVSSVILETAYG